jgi:hypothetical protein
LCPHNGWQHFSCILKPNVVRDVHAEATHNCKGCWWSTCNFDNACLILEKLCFSLLLNAKLTETCLP